MTRPRPSRPSRCAALLLALPVLVVGWAVPAVAGPLPSPTAATVTSASGTTQLEPVRADGRWGARRSTAWATRLDALIGDAPMSAAVGRPGRLWYVHSGRSPRVPASNEKLLLSMALLDRLGPDTALTTQVRAAARPDARGRVDGLWLVGSGDPYTDRSDLRTLARELRGAGVRVVTGDVVAAVGPFRRDDDAVGWKAWFPDVLVPLPTALTFAGNVGPHGSHPSVPEQRAAQALTAALQARGVTVQGRATTGRSPGGLARLAALTPPMTGAMAWMLQVSDNFAAEVLGKRLGRATRGTGTIASAAATICGLERRWDVTATCHDASGLSYANRQTARGMLRMLVRAQQQTWGDDLRLLLPAAGTGSLEGRLGGLDVRAKTGSLTNISALSGWVRVDSDGGWVAFSLLTRGIASEAAKRLEDRVVQLVARQASPPG